MKSGSWNACFGSSSDHLDFFFFSGLLGSVTGSHRLFRRVRVVFSCSVRVVLGLVSGEVGIGGGIRVSVESMRDEI